MKTIKKIDINEIIQHMGSVGITYPEMQALLKINEIVASLDTRPLGFKIREALEEEESDTPKYI